MINANFDDLVGMIKDKSSLSEEEIRSKIDNKLQQLSGLISKEGAAHIIANELGIELTQAPSNAQTRKKISEINGSDRSLEVVGRVVQVYEVREFNSNGRSGKVGNFLLGDDSGVTRIVLWNDKADLLKDLSQGTVVKITNCYARENSGRTELHLNDNSGFEINPAGEEIASVQNNRPEASRKKITELDIDDQNAEILGTIVQVFDPRFFEVDPDTGRRIRPGNDGKFRNASGEEVKPDFSYVFNLFVDDGSDNIRVVCFRNQMQNVLNLSHEEILEYKDDPMAFEDKKHELLGQMIKIQGRVVRNDMFDRLELISSRVFLNPDSEEELQRMNNDSPKTSSAPAPTVAPSSPEVVKEPENSSNVTSDQLGNVEELEQNGSEEPASEESPMTFDDETDGFTSADEVSEPEKQSENPNEKKPNQVVDDELDNLDELGDLEELDGLDDL